MRGRLIFPMTVEIARLDTVATRNAGKYDDVFKTMKPGEQPVYMAPVRLPAQVEMSQWQAQQQRQAGNSPDSMLTLVMHYRDLEARNLVSSTGAALFRVNDKLLAIYDKGGTRLEEVVSETMGGLYCTKVEPGGLGLGGRRNLLVMVFEQRARGVPTNP